MQELVAWWGSPVGRVVGGLFLFVVAGTTVGRSLPLLKPGRDHRKTQRSIEAWWPIVIGVLALTFLGRELGMVLGVITSGAAVRELWALRRTESASSRVLAAALYAAVPLQYLGIYLGIDGWMSSFVPLWAVLVVPLVALRGPVADFGRRIAHALWVLMVGVWALSHYAWLMMLPDEVAGPGGAAGIVVFMLLMTFLNDATQFSWGMAIGRTKIAPVLSPKKTWEGLIGGTLTNTFIGWVVVDNMTPFPDWAGAVLGAAFSIVGFGGDLVMSAVKRSVGVKDTGAAIPGQGGVMDRCDGLAFTTPLFALLCWSVLT